MSSGPCEVFTTADYGTHGDDLDLPESVTITPQHVTMTSQHVTITPQHVTMTSQHPPQDCGQMPEVQPLAPDVTDGYCSSGFESLTSSEQPFDSQELTVATPAPLEECALRSAFPPSQTGQGHCASEHQENYQHVPVECTEMDIHRAVSSSLDLLYCRTQPGCSHGSLGTGALAGGLDRPNNSNRLREHSWSPSARVEEQLDSCCRIPQQRGCCNSPGYSNRVITDGMAGLGRLFLSQRE